MKHAVILGHPSAQSFCAAVSTRYVEAVRRAGGEAVLRDLYEIQFDPRLSSAEMPRPQGAPSSADIVREREFIGDADVFAFVYPLWFNAPPAIVTGYVQRVFGMGFGFGPQQGGGNQPLLRGRKLVTLTSSGAPTEWLVRDGAWQAVQKIFDQHFADVCGMTVAERLHFGGITSTVRADVIAVHLERTEEAARALCRP